MTAANGSHRLNPATLLRMWDAFEAEGGKAVHVLAIGAASGCWPGTVYRAVELGYLRRVRPAWFEASRTMKLEVRRAQRIIAERAKTSQRAA